MSEPIYGCHSNGMIDPPVVMNEWTIILPIVIQEICSLRYFSASCVAK